MSSGGYVATAAGYVCVVVLREIGISAAEIGSTVLQVHQLAFEREALRMQQRTLKRIASLDREWQRELKKRARVVRKVGNDVTTAQAQVTAVRERIQQAKAAVQAPQVALSFGKQDALRLAGEAAMTLADSAEALAQAQDPVSAVLQESVRRQAADVKTIGRSIARVTGKVAGAQKQVSLSSAVATLRSLKLQAETSLAMAQAHAKTAADTAKVADETAQRLMRARVGIAILQESSFPKLALDRAVQKTGRSLEQIDRELRARQISLAGGEVSLERRDAARQLEAVVESGQKAAIRTVQAEARRIQRQSVRLQGTAFKVDTSGGIAMKRPGKTKRPKSDSPAEPGNSSADSDSADKERSLFDSQDGGPAGRIRAR